MIACALTRRRFNTHQDIEPPSCKIQPPETRTCYAPYWQFIQSCAILFIVDLSNLIIAGLVGTAGMTFFMYGMSFLTDRVMKVIRILGTMLTFRTTSKGELSDSSWATLVGTLAHYTVGLSFTLVYAEIWRAGLGVPTLRFGVVAGFVSGLVGILGWRVYFALHPQPPKNVPMKSYLLTLLVAHVVFGVIVTLTYQALIHYY